jgi:acyl-CoA-dependent ceramide synthase
VFFTFLREALIEWFWIPLASWWGVKNESQLIRFGEQGWNVFYYTLSFASGAVSGGVHLVLPDINWWRGRCLVCPSDALPSPCQYIIHHSPYGLFDMDQFWIGYPHEAILGLSKLYYLVQIAFWLQQIIVINIEKRRKDYYQMFIHHIVTIALMVLSYLFNLTRVGTATLCVMDLADIVLSASPSRSRLFKMDCIDPAFHLC